MFFTDFIRSFIADIIPSDLPTLFYWDRHGPRPEFYNVYQTENLSVSGKLDPKYLSLLDGAQQVFDYSNLNQAFYPSQFLPFKSENYSPVKKNDTWIFYGLMNRRRSEIIQRLPHRVKCYSELTFDKMKEILPGSNVISIGSYSNCLNDSLRTTIALNLGANLIVEPTCEIWYDKYLKTFGNKVGWIES